MGNIQNRIREYESGLNIVKAMSRIEKARREQKNEEERLIIEEEQRIVKRAW